jgi:DNA adenine methylase
MSAIRKEVLPTRPVLRYHGGKWVLAPWIISFFPPHRVYVEPFGGAGSVLIRKPRSYAEIWNDLDGEVVNLFRVLRSDKAKALINSLKLTPFARDELTLSYANTGDEIERARRLCFRSFAGRSSNSHSKRSSFRGNSNQSGTSPAQDWVNYPDALAIVVERLSGVVIENRDAQKVMAAHDASETLHYVDPPYVFSTRDAGRDYSHEMSDGDHDDLLVFLRGLRGMVVLSGYPNEIYDAALSDWRRVSRLALADGARERTEVLWLNPAASRALEKATAQQPLFGDAAE